MLTDQRTIDPGETSEFMISSMRNMRSLSLQQSDGSHPCCSEDAGVPRRKSSASEFATEAWSPGRFSSPSSPYAMSRWSNASSRPLYSFKQFQWDGSPPNGSYRCITSMLKRDGRIFSLAVRNGLVYTGSESKTIRVWRYPDFVEYGRFKSGSGNVRALLVTDDKIFSAHHDQKIRVWRRSRSNPSAHMRIGTLPTFRDSIYRYIKPRSYFPTGRNTFSSAKHSDVVSCLAYNSRDDLLYSGSWDKTVKVWRMSDFKCVETIRAHSDIVNAVAVGQVQGLLFSGSDDSTVKVWRRIAGGTNHMLVMALQIQFSPVKALALSALDGAVLYAGCSDGYINYWENAHLPGETHHAGFLRGHKHAILCLTTTGNMVFSGSADTTIRVWLREMGTVHCCLAVLEDHGGPVKCISASIDDANGCLVYSGSLEGIVKLWWVCVKTKSDTLSLGDDQEYFDLCKSG